MISGFEWDRAGDIACANEQCPTQQGQPRSDFNAAAHGRIELILESDAESVSLTWIYKTIYQNDGSQIGQWSNDDSSSVGGGRGVEHFYQR